MSSFIRNTMSSFIRSPMHLIFLSSFFVILLSLKFTIIYEYDVIILVVTIFVFFIANIVINRQFSDNILAIPELDKNIFAQRHCYYNKFYNPEYWHDATKYMGYVCIYLSYNDVSDEQLKYIVKDMHINECFGLYCHYYSHDNDNFNNNVWNRIIEYNPFKEDVIFNAYKVYFEKKGKLLSNDIMNYPTQKNKFINFLKKKIPDTEYEHFCRIKILREFLNEPKFNINHKEYGFLVENNDIHL
jgi:hypothetical protein